MKWKLSLILYRILKKLNIPVYTLVATNYISLFGYKSNKVHLSVVFKFALVKKQSFTYFSCSQYFNIRYVVKERFKV